MILTRVAANRKNIFSFLFFWFCLLDKNFCFHCLGTDKSVARCTTKIRRCPYNSTPFFSWVRNEPHHFCFSEPRGNKTFMFFVLFFSEIIFCYKQGYKICDCSMW